MAVTWSGTIPMPELRRGVKRQVGLVLLSVLERQALAGLAPAKRGGVVTLHQGTLAEIWSTATVDDDGTIRFSHRQAFLLDEYDAMTLRPEWQAVFDAEVAAVLAADVARQG